MTSRAARGISLFVVGAVLLVACTGGRAVRVARVTPGGLVPGGAASTTPTPSIYSPPPRERATEPPTVEIGGGDPAPAPTDVPASPPPDSNGPVTCGRSTEATVDAIEIETKTRCFEVHGTTWEEIHRAIHKEGPDVGSVDAVAATKWRIATNYYVVDKEDSCGASRITVSLAVTYDYPRVRPDPVGSLAAQWRSYMKDDVIPHEEHHGEIALEGARDLLKRLRQLPVADTCDQIRADLSRTVNQAVEATRREQDAFDHDEYGG